MVYTTVMLSITLLRILAFLPFARHALLHASTTEQTVRKTAGDGPRIPEEKPWDARPPPDYTGHIIFNAIHLGHFCTMVAQMTLSPHGLNGWHLAPSTRTRSVFLSVIVYRSLRRIRYAWSTLVVDLRA